MFFFQCIHPVFLILVDVEKSSQHQNRFPMLPTKGYAAHNDHDPLVPFEFSRRDPGPHDVLIEILYCGVCHSDLHQIRNEWHETIYPIVPGHEIVGRVVRTGNAVTRFKPGDLAGVGVFVDSCRECENCRQGLEQYCEHGMIGTYNSWEKDGKHYTFGGYSNQIVVDEHYVLHIPEKLDLKGVAPLLCAGITTYSPLRYLKVGKGTRVAIAGLGGLGHMGVKWAAAMGAEVTLLSSSPSKEADARRLGAHEFVLISDEQALKKRKAYFDVILNTISAPHDYNRYLKLLRLNGTMAVVGLPPAPQQVEVFNLTSFRRSIMGSQIGGIRETQEMLDYAAEKQITADVEVIAIHEINTALDRLARNDVKYRFVIDMSTLS